MIVFLQRSLNQIDRGKTLANGKQSIIQTLRRKAGPLIMIDSFDLLEVQYNCSRRGRLRRFNH